MIQFRPSHWLAIAVLATFSALAVAAPPVNTGFWGNTAIKGYDAVAYHTAIKAVKGKKEFSLEWNGATWLFASEAHLQLFKADPEKYAPQYGGYCAYAVAKGSTAGIDPNAFTIVGGKLYLNYSRKIQTQWEDDRDRYIQDADHNWPGVLN